MKFLQKLGKAIMLPVACLPLCGILMGVGYMLCPASLQGGEVSGILPLTGLFLVKAGGALIDNIAILFAVGIGAGMADDKDGTAAIAALVSWLVITTLLQTDNVKMLSVGVAGVDDALVAFDRIKNPFIGILAGHIGSISYNRFKDTSLPEWLAFFSGKRSTVIIAGLISVLTSGILLFVWPMLFGILTVLGSLIAGMGAVGTGIYAFLNRLLIPVGLHHALNNVFWFDTIGLGDITHYWAGHTSEDVSWSLGIYMSGFFPCIMFGIPGASLAMVHCAPKEKRKVAVGILASAALCAFVCGITEPFEFSFMFVAPSLYFIYALLYGVFSFVTAVVGFRAGFAFSAGATDLLFSASLPAAAKTWMILPLGAAAFVVFYVVFRVLITKFDLKTPGREDDGEAAGVPVDGAATGNSVDGVAVGDPVAAPVSGQISEAGVAAGAPLIVDGFNIDGLLEGLGGKANIQSLDNCITRLRVDVKDYGAVDSTILEAAGAKAVVKTGAEGVQVVIGMKVQGVADAMRKRM